MISKDNLTTTKVYDRDHEWTSVTSSLDLRVTQIVTDKTLMMHAGQQLIQRAQENNEIRLIAMLYLEVREEVSRLKRDLFHEMNSPVPGWVPPDKILESFSRLERMLQGEPTKP